MIGTARRVYDIRRVVEVEPCAGGTRLSFEGGLSACVAESHPAYGLILHLANGSRQHGVPVGFILGDDGKLLELNDTHQSTVSFVRPDEEGPNRLMVAFWAYSPICYLTRDHPDFARILQTLEQAARNHQPVVLANCMNMVEGEAETWWKIMDVRPAR